MIKSNPQDDQYKKEQVIMNITGHRSVDAVRKYKVPNDQIKNLKFHNKFKIIIYNHYNFSSYES